MEYKVKVSNKFHFCSDDEDVADPSELLARAIANKKKKKEEDAMKKKVADEKAKETPVGVVAKPPNEQRKPTRDGEKRNQSTRGRGGFRGGERRPREEGRPKRTEEKAPVTTEEGVDDDFEINRRPPRNNGKKPNRKMENGERKPRASGSNKTGVRAMPKREGFGKGNWGTQKDELAGETEPLNQQPTDESENVAPVAKNNDTAEIPEEEKTLTLEEYKAQLAAAKKDETPFNIRQISEQEFKKLNLIPIQKKKVEQTTEEVEIIRREPRKQVINLDLKFVDTNKKTRRDNRDNNVNRRGNNRRGKQPQGFVYKENAFPALGSA
uniref:HABP4_PAI-RBP1 domain-containing protein n=1 Tax=Strongyloides venezuelensis TaxID=75913 RepID=A0A0K0FCR7_STRVS